MRTRFTSFAMAVTLGLLSQALAEQTDKTKHGIALCDMTLNSTLEAIRNGEFERARRSSPALQDCLSIYKAVRYEEVKKSVIVEDVLKKLELERRRARQ